VGEEWGEEGREGEVEGEEWREEEGWVLGVLVGGDDNEETRIPGTESTVFT